MFRRVFFCCLILVVAGVCFAQPTYVMPDPVLSATASKTNATLAFDLVSGNDATNINFYLSSYYDSYYWNSYTKLSNNSAVEIVNANFGSGATIDNSLSFGKDITLASYYRTGSMWDGWDSPSYSGVFGGGAAEQGYLGLKVADNGNNYYGWMNVTITGGARETLVVSEWYLNDVAGEGVTTGEAVAAVPVPGAFLLGGIGVSIVGWMRRRKSL